MINVNNERCQQRIIDLTEINTKLGRQEQREIAAMYKPASE